MNARVLVLGGTTESSALVRILATQWPSLAVTLSFAGRTSTRAQAPAPVRVGGFGGAEGLRRYLLGEAIVAVVDATHPFAARMPFNVEAACTAVGVPRLRLVRPPWRLQPQDRWLEVADMAAAAETVSRNGVTRVLLTIGRQEVAAFSRCPAAAFVVRSIDPPDLGGFVGADPAVVLARGPFSLADELDLLRSQQIDLVVSKNAGGEATRAKIDACRVLGLPVVMVARPAGPASTTVETANEAVRWLVRALGKTEG